MVAQCNTANSKKPLSNSHYWLAVKLIPRLSTAKKIVLVEQVGLHNLFSATSEILIEYGLNTPQRVAILQPNWTRINDIISASIQCNSVIITLSDAKYPKQLKEIYDPPLVLFTLGNIALLQQVQIAVVGSRNATATGREIAHAMAGELTQHNVVVTSGLALGIDAQAHCGALTSEGYTIAVVATGLDQIYPSRHKKLQKDILQNHGLIISEFEPGTPPKAGHFPKRNRLISGLSIGVVVVEASLKSGSLITARCALEQGREVFAIPSSILNKQAKGCHWLIKQGAKLVEECADILDELENLEKNGLNLLLDKEKDKLTEKSNKKDLFKDPM
jgi:DNA processing protein